MSGAWDDIGATPAAESYEQALARSLVGQKTAPLTEQQLAEREIEARERMRLHDEFYRRDYIQGTEAMLVSRALAKQYGVHINEPDDDRPGGDD